MSVGCGETQRRHPEDEGREDSRRPRDTKPHVELPCRPPPGGRGNPFHAIWWSSRGHRFVDLAQAEREIAAFIERYDAEWLVERHGHCSPRAVRAQMQAAA